MGNEGGYTVVTFPMNKLNGRIVTPNEPQNEPQNEHQNEPQKRALTIESLIVENESISINAIAERLNAARITVRRDLKRLGYAWEGASKNGRWVKKG